MDILIVTAFAGSAMTGNRCTASQWADQLSELGHDVDVTDSYRGEDARVLVALHATKSHAAILGFRRDHPHRRIVVALTGTDVYPAPGDTTLDSLRMADRIVGLQPRVREQIPAEFRDRLRIIIRGAPAFASNGSPARQGPFDICVVCHLRAVKDPLRAAAASRLLPAQSQIRIRHAGAILEAEYRGQVEREQAENPRYRWLGELLQREALELMAGSHLLVLSSFFEGGARVVGESISAGTPVLAARNDATCELLGGGYAGLYDAADTRQLADLMMRAESEGTFMDALREQSCRLAARFDPRREREAWRALIAELDDDTDRTVPA